MGCAVYMGVGSYGDFCVVWFIVASFTIGERVSRSGLRLLPLYILSDRY